MALFGPGGPWPPRGALARAFRYLGRAAQPGGHRGAPARSQPARDETFALFTVHQAAAFVACVVRAFSDLGVEVVVHPGYVETSGGRRFGLHQLAAACSGSSRGARGWGRIIDAHVRTVVEELSRPDPLLTASTADVEPNVYLCLRDVRGLAAQGVLLGDYPREVFPGVVEVLAHDRPNAVRYFTDESLSRFDIDRLRSAGLANLVREPLGPSRLLRGRDGAALHVIDSPSFYVASQLLVPRQVLAREFGEREYPHGVLMAAPFRHQLLTHQLTGPDVIPSLNAMVRITDHGYRTRVDRLSPHVYWWDGARVHQISSVLDDGQLAIQVKGPFAAALDAAVSLREAP
jgi:hypothetical protein